MMWSKYGDNHIRDNLTKRSFPQLEFDVTERDEGHDTENAYNIFRVAESGSRTSSV